METIIKNFKNYVVQISTPYGNGSGFFLKDIPFIITNCHVIDLCSEVTVKKSGSEKMKTSVLFTDKLNDIALLANPFENVSEAVLSETPATAGSRILAIGHPLGLSYTATQGIVSKEDRIYNGLKYIQIDAAINPGNSGGPLVNYQGQVIGINSAKNQEAGFEGMGFAIPISDALPTIKQMIEKGYASHPGLNVQIDPRYTAEYASQKGWPAGAYVSKVTSGGPAEKAGILPGDVLTKLNGQEIKSSLALTRELFKFKPGDKVTITIFRANKTIDASVVLTEIKSQ